MRLPICGKQIPNPKINAANRLWSHSLRALSQQPQLVLDKVASHKMSVSYVSKSGLFSTANLH